MSSQVLAQKYRPRTFEDVVGQEAVTRTLRNSILQGRIANAYIFCGPRGVGKTSIARVLSKTLNCEKPPDKSPCNSCASCAEIALGSNIDVLEIDGASNRGIDEIRTLRENVKFSPSKGKFKIYIIDEVHMLTQEAFNALLKTLEEPPAHVKFIFATTEPHKVLPTILSRCQKFNFKKISPKMIFDRILDVTKKERINIEEKAALLIARSSDGSLRDSLVILDQMVSFSGEKILHDDVIELLGMVQRDKIFELSDAVIESDPGRAVRMLDGMINNGKDPVLIANSLTGHWRDLMVLKVAGSPTSDMAFSAEELKRSEAQLEKLSLEEILYVLQNLSHCLALMKGAMFARVPLELTLIRLTRRGAIVSLPDILARLEKMEEACRGTGSGHLAEARVRPEPVLREGRSAAAGSEGNEPPAAGFGAVKFQWKAVLAYVKKKKMSVFAFLSVAKPVEVSGNKVVIGFGKDHAFHKETLEAGDNKCLIEEAVNRVTGSSLRVEFVLLEISDRPGDTGADDPGKETEAKEKMKPVIDAAMDVFGGCVVRDITEGGK